MTDPALRGGHWLDTGEGLTSVDPPAPVEPSPAGRATAAYDRYTGHLRGCQQCIQSVFRCDLGDALWDAYTGAR